MTVVRRSL
jgi:hypothetical protein